MPQIDHGHVRKPRIFRQKPVTFGRLTMCLRRAGEYLATAGALAGGLVRRDSMSTPAGAQGRLLWQFPGGIAGNLAPVNLSQIRKAIEYSLGQHLRGEPPRPIT